MGRKKLLFSALMALSFSAFGAEPYFVASFGQNHIAVDRASFDASLARGGATNIRSTVDETSNAYKVLLGYQFTKEFALEGGYVDLGDVSYNATAAQGTAGSKLRIKGFTLSGVFLFPVGDTLSFFGKIGAIAARSKVSYTASGSLVPVVDSVSASNTSVTSGVGLSYSFDRNLALRVEFERFSQLGDEQTTGTANADLVSVGLAVKF